MKNKDSPQNAGSLCFSFPLPVEATGVGAEGFAMHAEPLVQSIQKRLVKPLRNYFQVDACNLQAVDTGGVPLNRDKPQFAPVEGLDKVTFTELESARAKCLHSLFIPAITQGFESEFSHFLGQFHIYVNNETKKHGEFEKV